MTIEELIKMLEMNVHNGDASYDSQVFLLDDDGELVGLEIINCADGSIILNED